MDSLKNPEHEDAKSILWTLSRRILMVIALTLAFFLSAVLTIYIMFRSGDTRVPDVLGKTESDAKGVMEAGKFEIKIQRRNDDAPLNTVIETRPSPNSSVKTNSVITLVVSNGPVQNSSELRGNESKIGVCGLRFLVTKPIPLPIDFSSALSLTGKPQIRNRKLETIL